MPTVTKASLITRFFAPCEVGVSAEKVLQIKFNFEVIYDKKSHSRSAMEENRDCKKCSRCVDAHVDLFTVCEGDCAGLFHIKCVGLKEEDVDVLTCSQNILWMCDACMDKFRKMRDSIRPYSDNDVKNTKTIENEVQELKNTVTDILATLSKLVSTTSTTDDAELLHSTPNSLPTLCNGTNGCVAAELTDEENLQHVRATTNEDNFSLFLSNIDPCATEWDVRSMVSRCLGVSEPERLDVTKLTKNWNNTRALDFVSFKVVLSKKWKTNALNSSTWPVKIKIKEIIYKHNETWRP